MVGVYKTGPLSWLGAKLLVRSKFFLLPNIIAEREIVPEYVPYAFGPGPIVRETCHFLGDSKHTAVLSEQLRRVCLRFANKELKGIQVGGPRPPPFEEDESGPWPGWMVIRPKPSAP